MKAWLQASDIDMYSEYNGEKPVVAERFIRTLNSKIYKYITPISINVIINKFADIVNEH